MSYDDTMPTEQELQDELTAYTLALRDPAFIHQHVVDAFAAQHATHDSKPIQVVFALIGLYLHHYRGFTGRQVQRAHMKLGVRRRKWVMPTLPFERGAVHVSDVMAAPPGPQRDSMIDVWCASVWQAYSHVHSEIAEIARRELGVN